jgi:Protein of unknown function (DUF5672)
MKLKLKDTTLLAIGIKSDYLLTKKSFDICNYYCDFEESFMICSKDTQNIDLNNKNIKFTKMLNSQKEYDIFCIKELKNFLETKFMLLVHPDSWICNPDAWTDEYYEYDYIGAPWYWGVEKGNLPQVGNGGFNFRSKKLIEEVYNESINDLRFNQSGEDMYICCDIRKKMEDKGIKFCPYHLADKFSIETKNAPWNGEFGFHSTKLVNLENWRSPI